MRCALAAYQMLPSSNIEVLWLVCDQICDTDAAVVHADRERPTVVGGVLRGEPGAQVGGVARTDRRNMYRQTRSSYSGVFERAWSSSMSASRSRGRSWTSEPVRMTACGLLGQVRAAQAFGRRRGGDVRSPC